MGILKFVGKKFDFRFAFYEKQTMKFGAIGVAFGFSALGLGVFLGFRELACEPFQTLDKLITKEIMEYLRDQKKIDARGMCDFIDEYWLGEGRCFASIESWS